jgi:CHAD domain-containing protein
MGRAKVTPVSVTWHAFDGSDSDDLLSASGGMWRLERPLAENGLTTGLETIAQAPSPSLLMPPVAHVVPVVAFTGQTRSLALQNGLRLVLTHGTLRHVSGERGWCDLRIEGEAGDAARLALTLGEGLALSMATVSLGEEATSWATGGDAPLRVIGAPDAQTPVGDAIGAIIGALAAALLRWAPVAARGDTDEGVHQMRVATRRLRSAMLVFKEPLRESLDPLRAPLSELADRLGAARDWDVFLTGTASELVQAMPGERRIASLVGEAERQRAASYAALRAYLAAPATRRFFLQLALLPWLKPWMDGGASDLLAMPIGAYAPRVLERRYKRLIKTADDLACLPAEALHETRKSGKKLRYALEFFADALPRRKVRRLSRHLSRAQDELGAINDTETGAVLLARLTRGGAHEFASGAVLGWLSARAVSARLPLAETWKELRRQDRFWRDHRAVES